MTAIVPEWLDETQCGRRMDDNGNVRGQLTMIGVANSEEIGAYVADNWNNFLSEVWLDFSYHVEYLEEVKPEPCDSSNRDGVRWLSCLIFPCQTCRLVNNESLEHFFYSG